MKVTENITTIRGFIRRVKYESRKCSVCGKEIMRSVVARNVICYDCRVVNKRKEYGLRRKALLEDKKVV